MSDFSQHMQQLIATGKSLIDQFRLNDSNRPLRLRFADLPAGLDAEDVLLVQQARCDWQINGNLQLELVCLSSSTQLSLTPFLGQALSLDMVTDRGQLFSLNGIVTGARAGQADGSLTQYIFQINDATHLLKLTRNSRVFLGNTVPEITYTIFNQFAEINPVFRSVLSLNTDFLQKEYPVLDFVYQSEESSWDFLKRIWAQAGISFWIEPVEAYNSLSQFIPAAADSIKQQLVLFDSNDAITAADTGALRYHRADGTEMRDTITRFNGHRQIMPVSAELQQWDVNQSASLPVLGQSTLSQTPAVTTGLIDRDLATALHPEDEPWLQTTASNRTLAYELGNKVFEGSGSVRDLHIGRWFELQDHPELDANHSAEDREFAVLGVHFVAQNNLPKQLLASLLSAPNVSTSTGVVSQLIQLPIEAPERFKSWFTLVRRNVPVVPFQAQNILPPSLQPATLDIANQAVKPVPNRIIGVVVGPAGEEVYVDKDYRVQVRFPHLSADDHSHQGGRGTNNADGDSCWLPVMTPLAGHQFGHSFIPRIGQTVVIDFLNGDVNRPMITGCLFDGTHAPAQFSHSGELPANRYLSGIVSKEIGSSRSNQLKLDDTNGQLSAALHSDEAASQLNLGHLTHPRNGKAETRGQGFEVRTDGQGAIRSGKGLYLTTHAQIGASGNQMAARESKDRLAESLENIQYLDDYAKKQNADISEAIAQIKDFISKLESQWQEAIAVKDALLLLASADSLGMSAEKDLHAHAKDHLSLSAGKSILQSSTEHTVINAKKKLSLFAGEDTAKLIAGKGQMDIQAQNNLMNVLAKLNINIASTDGIIQISSPKRLDLIGPAGKISLHEGGITLNTDKLIKHKAAQHQVVGGEGSKLPSFILPNTVCLECLKKRALQRTSFVNKGSV